MLSRRHYNLAPCRWLLYLDVLFRPVTERQSPLNIVGDTNVHGAVVDYQDKVRFHPVAGHMGPEGE